MNNLDNGAFISLFKECFLKCYGFPFAGALSETESKHLGNKIFEETGLVIGAKSLKNYSLYILNPDVAKQENPSIATLDTMARYVLGAPFTDELKRKDKEAHYPYWFQYRNRQNSQPAKKTSSPSRKRWVWWLVPLAIIAVAVALLLRNYGKEEKTFMDDFSSLQEDSLYSRGWWLQLKDDAWWNQRTAYTGALSLFTLKGDNWPDTAHTPQIKNLLVRKIMGDCFTAEIHLTDFMPATNWQQAGILLLEDTAFQGKAVRISIAYNDFFGGYQKPKEIIIQGVSSGGLDMSKPEEIGHLPVVTIQGATDDLIHKNLQFSGLRIEKTKQHFRFLYSTSPVENFAFKEAFAKELPIHPKYIALFALKGFVDDTNHMAARFTFFSILPGNCD